MRGIAVLVGRRRHAIRQIATSSPASRKLSGIELAVRCAMVELLRTSSPYVRFLCLGVMLGGSGLLGCDGLVEEGAIPAPGPGFDPDEPVVRSALDARRLTQSEYANTIQEVFGVDVQGMTLPPDGVRRGYLDNRTAPMTSLAVDQYGTVAAHVAETMNLASLAPCAAGTVDEACAVSFIEAVGPRAFRRPVGDGERAALLELYRSVAPNGTEAALRLVVEAMLQSPRFLLHLDPADPGDPGQIDPYALVSRLSYLLFESPPDEPLLALAASGALRDPAELAALTDRMLADPRAEAGVTRFFRQWLELSSAQELAKDPERYPTYDVEVANAMLEETDRYVDFVVREGDGQLDTLLTGTFSFVPASLRPVYGLADGNADAPVALDPNERAGLLTHPSVLASHARFSNSSPVLRGVFLFRRVLCGQLGDPPAGIDTSLEPSDPLAPQTTAERLAVHREDPQCAVCHDSIDPLGLAFENYGALGEWRDDDNGLPIPEPLPLQGTDVDGPVVSATELANRLSESRMVQDCAVDQWLQYTALEFDDAARDALKERFQSSDHNIRDLIVATVVSPSFRARGEDQ
ncbi:MAG: DUF1592 domain-containing protein [Myxococcota bacterium]